uniref:Leucine rich repeats-containing protein n=1 Tax=Trepomonas sp. PC1 TaxID=1076344 RepID=A0A146KCL0_9EUKA|eukprot:JAP93191.1 Leucine rich repeats-containing protein [Trepomonas sp. PC1]
MNQPQYVQINNTLIFLDKQLSKTDIEHINMKFVLYFIAPFVETIDSGVFLTKQQIRFAWFPRAKQFGDRAFAQCKNLFSIVCDNVEEIGEECFKDCYNLTSATLNRIKQLPSKAFNDTAIQLIRCDSCIKIAKDCCNGNLQLETIDFATLTKINFDSNFQNCKNLVNFRMPMVKNVNGEIKGQINVSADSNNMIKQRGIVNDIPKTKWMPDFINRKLNNIGDKVLNRTLVTQTFQTQQINRIKGLVLLNQISIQQEVFYDNKMLNFVYAPLTKSVEYMAFQECYFLSRFISHKLQFVGKQAFCSCYALSDIDLSKVTTIEEDAFFNTSLVNVKLPCLEKLCNCLSDQVLQVIGLKLTSISQQCVKTLKIANVVAPNLEIGRNQEIKFQEIYIDRFAERWSLKKSIEKSSKICALVRESVVCKKAGK